MRHRGLWSEGWEKEISDRYNQAITDALAASDQKHAPAIETMFDDVYEELPWNLREQRDYLMKQARTKNPHHHG
jgi:TPP-dependent pyruvate/acetoin dehydrogenase alpha subunit